VPEHIVAEFVDKQELCALLSWSRPRLDRTIERDANFPVYARGTGRGAPWKFDPDAVLQYLGVTPLAARQPAGDARGRRAGDSDAAPRSSAPATPIGHRGEATARQKRELLQAMILVDKIKLSRGELYEGSAINQILGEEMASLGAFLNSLPENIIRVFGLPGSLQEPMAALIADERRKFVANVRRRLDAMSVGRRVVSEPDEVA
jgi:hypothetical protein